MAAEPAPLDRAPTPSAPPVTPVPSDVAVGVTPPRHRGGSRRPLVDVLVELRYVSREGLELVEHTARTSGRTPDQVLVAEGAITADQLARAVAVTGETAWKLLPLPGAPPLTRFAAWVASKECTIDDTRARTELGYAPVVTREAGMRELRDSV